MKNYNDLLDKVQKFLKVKLTICCRRHNSSVFAHSNSNSHDPSFLSFIESLQSINQTQPTGKLFVHIFTHKDYTYEFDQGWMSENFFSGYVLLVGSDVTC
jgi:hypothetical protein